MSGFKRSLIGVVILALLGGYYYFYEIRYRGRKAKEKEISEKLYPVERADVTKVVYKKGQTEIVLEKTGNGWVITAPVKTDADAKTVNNFLKTFQGLKSFRTLKDVKWDDPDFGLKKAPVHVTLYTKKGKAYMATFGGSNPTKSYTYALKGDKKTVLLVWVYPRKLLNETLYDFRFKKVASLDADRVKRIHFVKGDEAIDLKRVGKHQWKIVSPIKTRGDRYSIEGFISAATDEKVIRFLDNPPQKPEEFGWDHPKMKIDLIWTQKAASKGEKEKKGAAKAGVGEKTMTILVGKNRDNKHVYVKVAGSPSVLVVKNSYLKDLDKKVYDFRDKNVWNYEIDDVIRVGYENREKNLVIEAKKLETGEGTWELVKPEKVRADTRAVENWLWDLSGFRVKKFLDRGEFEKQVSTPAKPDLSFEIGVKGRKAPLTLKLYHVGETWIARGDEPNWFYVLDAKDVQKTFKTVFDLRYRRIVAFEDTNVAKVEIKTEKASRLFFKKKNRWYEKLGENKEKIPNIDVLNFLWELGDLKYSKILKKTPKQEAMNSPVHVALFDKEGKPMGDVRFRETKDGLKFIFTVKGKKDIYLIDRARANKFEKAYRKLTSKKKKKEE